MKSVIGQKEEENLEDILGPWMGDPFFLSALNALPSGLFRFFDKIVEQLLISPCVVHVRLISVGLLYITLLKTFMWFCSG
jgi:hypothetical protein